MAASPGATLPMRPDKTFIGRIEKGLDFLGYHFGPDGLGVARATIEKFIKRASRLYEQKRIGKVAPDALGRYMRRWSVMWRLRDGAEEWAGQQRPRRTAASYFPAD